MFLTIVLEVEAKPLVKIDTWDIGTMHVNILAGIPLSVFDEDAESAERTLEIVDSLHKYFQSFAEAEDPLVYLDERFKPKYAYGNAARLAVMAYEYLTEGDAKAEENEKIPCAMHFEFVGKSVKEEEKQYLAALLTVMGYLPNGVGTVAGVASFVISVLDANESAKEVRRVKGVIGAEDVIKVKEMRGAAIGGGSLWVDGLVKTYEEIPGVEDLGKIRGDIFKIKDTFDVITALHYEIHDNWVYCIRAYTFTEEYLFYAEQFLDKNCQKVGEISFFPSVERRDYVNMRRGSNIAWGGRIRG